MSISRIATRYAKSLLDIALEKNALEEVYQDVKGFEKALESRDFYNMLRSPVIPSTRKAEIFKLLFDGKASPITYGFFLLVIKKSREVVFPEIVQAFFKQYRKHKNIIVLRLITAAPISDENAAKVKSILKDKGIVGDSTIEMHTKVDPDLIGGFQVEFEDKLIDASIQHKLDLMRRELAINLYESKIRSI